MAKKIIGVDNLNVIRDFVLSKVMAESDDIRKTLTEENAEYLHNKLLEASESLKTDYESKYESLNNRIDTLKSEGVNAEELHELELQIDRLNNNYLDMQKGLSAIEDSIIDIENSVMSPSQLNELIDTALIDRTTITDEYISSENVYAQNLVSLIAKFGTVRALNIVGDEIEGKTISAYDKIEGTDEPTWKLDRQGNGYLANKNISWDKDGNVTFGENVKIGWNNEWDEKIPEIPEGGLTESEVESMISTEISKYEVKAENIKGTTLEGKTIKSSDDAWKLDMQGDGYLAKGNIRWDNAGNVEFGPNVTIGWNDEWDEKIPDIPEGGLTEGDVDNRISTALSKYKVTSENIEGTTIKGSVIKTKYLSDMKDSGAFYLDGESGVFGLGNDAILYDGDDVYISGDNVHIDGDVLINGTAIMNGIESDDSAKQQLDELIAGKIDAAEIKTSVLETKSSVNDSVRISDNYIHCFNDSGDKNLIISSNKMDTSKLDRILGSGYTSQQGTGMVLSNVTLSKPSGSSVYSNQSVWYSHTSPCSLGYILEGSTVTVNVALQALNVASSNYNSMSSSQYVPAANWTISEGTGQVPYVVGGGGTKYAGGMLLVYKKNDSGEWEEYDGGWLKGTWQDCAQPWTSSGTATTKYYKCIIDSSSIDIEEDGEYGIRLGMEVSSIQAAAATTVKSIAGLLKASVNQKQPSTYTEIGKDGIVVYDGTNVLRLDSSGVVMMAKTSTGSSKFYGLKVTKDGFYLCKNGDSWREWDPSFD